MPNHYRQLARNDIDSGHCLIRLSVLFSRNHFTDIGAVTRRLDCGCLFCCSPLSFYCSGWSTVDVPFVHITIGQMVLDPISRAEYHVFA